MSKSLKDYKSSLIDSLSSAYVSHQKILVYVEGIEDVSFWYNILSHYEKQTQAKFDIQPYSNQKKLVTGKSNLKKLFKKTRKDLIICLDSDYDYLLSSRLEIAKAINENPYIFQTYAYSMENLKCYAESLRNVCVQVTNNTFKEIDFPKLLEEYSKIIYKLFVWHLYLCSKKEDTRFPICELSKIIRIEKDTNIDNYMLALNNIKSRVDNKLHELKGRLPSSYEKNVDSFAQMLTPLGLEYKNTYLFIKGHNLYNDVVLILLKAECHKLREKTESEISASSTSQLNQYKSLTADIDKKVEDTLAKNDKFMDCFLFKKIEKDIENYLELLKDTTTPSK